MPPHKTQSYDIIITCHLILKATSKNRVLEVALIFITTTCLLIRHEVKAFRRLFFFVDLP